jgi:hypothetical protein
MLSEIFATQRSANLPQPRIFKPFAFTGDPYTEVKLLSPAALQMTLPFAVQPSAIQSTSNHSI